jgi:hypothetical protein
MADGSGLGLSRVLSATFFVVVGVSFCAWWVVADPTHEISDTQDEWPYVLAFSGVILLLAIAVPLFARLIGDALVLRFRSSWPGAPSSGVSRTFSRTVSVSKGSSSSSFFCLMIIDLSLLALVILLAVRERGGRRLLALVPAGTLLAIIFAVEVGGPLMLVTWLGAAFVAVAVPPHRA